MNLPLNKLTLKSFLTAAACVAAMSFSTANACTGALNNQNNAVGTHNGYYYSFWKQTNNSRVNVTCGEPGYYRAEWSNVFNWVGGVGWNPGGPRIVNYRGTFNSGINRSSSNSYLALYGWTRAPTEVEYYIVESYGSYNPANCGGSGGVAGGGGSGDGQKGSVTIGGVVYDLTQCTRTNQPSISGTSTFKQFFSVRRNPQPWGQIQGTIDVGAHFQAWANAGMRLGTDHFYMVLASEGYDGGNNSRGNSELWVTEGAGGGGAGGGTSSTPVVSSSRSSSSVASGSGTTTGGGVVVRARGVAGGEHINLRIGGNVVADWTLTNSFQDLAYTGNASGDIQVQYDNDGGSRDVVVDYIRVNGETRQAEDMDYNTGLYANGSCGGGGNSELMHCNGAIGFGFTYDCFSGNCSGGSTGGGATSSTATSTGGGNAACTGYVGITFDDGPTANTPTLVNLLKQNNLTPVTWFNQGNNVVANANYMAQQLSVGEVHNHSYSHPQMGNMSYQQVYDELNRANQAIQNAGAPKPTLFRPPYGTVNSTIQQAAQALGLRVITWDVDSQDWNGATASAIASAANRLQNGQVILMHDGSYTNTNAAIAQIAASLRAKGLCPGRIDAATGRAVAPAGGSVASSSRSSTPVVASSSRSSTPVVASSSRSSTPVVASSSSRSSTPVVASSSSSVSTGGQCQCNWWGTLYPTCQNTASGWGWENSRSCITTATCNSQGAYGGGQVCN